MDIKDFILVGGGILIVLVIAHGFWIAYRAKKEPYRLDIVPDLIPDHVDDMERLRGELPNGGARVIRRRGTAHVPEQDSLDLQPPGESHAYEMEANPDSASGMVSAAAANSARSTEAITEKTKEPTPTLMDVAEQRKPRVFQAPPRLGNTRAESTDEAETSAEVQENLPLSDGQVDRQVGRQDAAPGAHQEPSIGEPITDPATARVADVQLVTEPRVRERTLRPVESQPASSAANDESPALDRTVEELLIINVVASKGHRFFGEDIVRALRGQGLTYGEMNIFHRKDPMTKAKQFSIANLVEPGTFDLSDLDRLQSPGMSFFLQLPGPEDATDAFDAMMAAAQHVAFELGGELRDEQMSVLTGQTREHMRQRIADFARRRLSARA